MSNMTKSPKRQLAYVADLNKCIGCQTCTVASRLFGLWTWTGLHVLAECRNRPRFGGIQETGRARAVDTRMESCRKGEDSADDRLWRSLRIRTTPVGFLKGKERARPSPTPRSAPNWDEDQERANIPTTPFSMCRGCATTAPSRHVLKPARMKRYTSASKTAWW